MKKYPLVHFTFVLTVIAVACGLLIGGVNAITAPIILENEKQATLEAYSAVMPNLANFTALSIDNDPVSIEEKVEAYDASNNLIGFIFKASDTNGYGDMTIVVAINVNGTIVGAEFLTLNQTLNLEYTRSNLQLFVGSAISDLTPSGDLQSGATYSKETMIGILEDISISFADAISNVVVDPYVTFFGEGYIVSNDGSFVSVDEVVSKDIVKDANDTIVGYVYEVTGLGVGPEGSEPTSITLIVTLDTNNQILSVIAPAELYHHSLGGYYTAVKAYLETLAGINLSAFDSSADLTAGATNSKTLVNELLDSLKGVVIPA